MLNSRSLWHLTRVAEFSVLFGICELHPRFSSVRRRRGKVRSFRRGDDQEERFDRETAGAPQQLSFFPSFFPFSSAELTGAIPSFPTEITNMGITVGGKYLCMLVSHVCVIFFCVRNEVNCLK